MLEKRSWVPDAVEGFVARVARETERAESLEISARIEELAQESRRIHERNCFNLNPATNVMNPRAEALLASGMGSRPSLGYPGDKYETGLEAIEKVEIIAAALATEIFGAKYAEIRVPSGAMANLYGFMALCKPGDAIIAPPASVGGHVTHHEPGCAGLFGLDIHPAPVNADGYTVDLGALRNLAQDVRPRLITIGGSLNLFPHPVAEIRAIADAVGAHVLFDAAHQCGIIAGGAWPNPLEQGAHMMTMSTYKSLGGPPAGLIVTDDAMIAERLDAIAFPGMTANFDAAKSAALAMSLLDWRDHGSNYAATMVDVARALARALEEEGLPVFAAEKGGTQSHQFALLAKGFGGGQAAAKTLRKAGFLACGIGLPVAEVPGDMNGLRIGTPEMVRWGMTANDAPRMASLIAGALRANDPAALAEEVAEWRRSFDTLHFIHQ
ncbi:aminotransferase class I/II-fold pyridoxal phosphate-dependent enzyme [Lutimaribacter sp. EGI FJ00015]|uniref:Aminotransferase class I/II-fold pyridoxal phosphate-dependent enzyme n=1 Tax=Lutimaribacter degradans TaxID=2945989 RepID=A0ACC6A0E6_9RHOB|nr:aminotransferase class I/II-fold pyridoxal phosphate-dependent enzyme [Lutimaribacter sp. EGI FJ00013]MCM2563481.1 aminotransferase class I/II-fold pyridoxal phosphate-dependent enzyme [Lutimaribacter sp. EGI FJ00013]MCO0614661.1 aminotransferase class I/II-fold pyridoxal phosphate-dependent enzyme [Lutimaribacter sp. EGI FJ00015]MCO0637331.1 aminotransferase class I/II-fold pyridoxal phosphate-dependent enzyme [Lutimaribacter sp. EGI FJ00014]